jgi:hypothetical protein
MNSFIRRLLHTFPGTWGVCCAFLIISAAPAGAFLVVNGDFQNGNQDFYSDFTYSPGDLVPEYTYDVVSNPSLDHPNAESFYDHTLGTAEGLMMAVNGIAVPGDPNVVWEQTVDVTPSHTYDFACWHSLWAPGDAGLQVLVNGEPLGPEFMAGGALGEWIFYEATWYSGDAAEAILEIVNTTVSYTWNDFCLDDISFAPETPVERVTWAGIKSAWE